MKLPDVLNATIYNFAASGSSTKSFFDGSFAVDGIPSGQPNSIHRWANLLSSYPNYVFISFGWNDKGAANDPERYCTISEYQTNLGRMIDEARNIGAAPLLLTSPPGRYFNPDGTISNGIRDYCDVMIQVAQSKSAASIDLNALMVNLYETLGPTFAPLMGFNSTDSLHLGECGAKQVARLIADQIPSALPALASNVIPGGDQIIVSNGGSTLTLSPDITNAFRAPLVLKKTVTINGSGSVYFDGGIQGSYGLTVHSGSVNASSIVVDSLTIGGGGAAVSEPSTFILLGISVIGLIAYDWRRHKA
jgi:lysophospholipase L1-like esterase